jgi:hypothetical protein
MVGTWPGTAKREKRFSSTELGFASPGASRLSLARPRNLTRLKAWCNRTLMSSEKIRLGVLALI